VTLAVAESLYSILASKLSEVTFLLLPHDLGALIPDAWRVLREHIPDYTSMLLGPGLGRDSKTDEFVAKLVGTEAAAKGQLGFVRTKPHTFSDPNLPPLVIDADACNALARIPSWWERLLSPAILTPHPGEMGRLLDCSTSEVQADRIRAATTVAREWGKVVVLKGAYTVTAAPGGEATINPFANPGLASAGTGDVLAGSIVGFLAQGLSPYDAAIAGAYVHGLAGRLVAQRMGKAGMVAGDLLPELPRAIMELSGSDQQGISPGPSTL
jgi:NAD(P)H-hydrate epimerase